MPFTWVGEVIIHIGELVMQDKVVEVKIYWHQHK